MNWVVIDTETTGLDSRFDRIIEIAALTSSGQTLSTLINPGRPIPTRIQELTGIRSTRNAPTLAQVADQITDILTDRILIAHNSPFDLGFIRAGYHHHGLVPPASTIGAVCTQQAAMLTWPTQRSFRLNQLAKDLHIPVKRSHRALDDAQTTARIYDLLLKEKGRQINNLGWRLFTDTTHPTRKTITKGANDQTT